MRDAPALDLRGMLRTLHLTGMADTFADLALKAATAHLTYESYLTEVVACECVLRAQRRLARLLRQSGLPAEKTFHTLKLDRFPPVVQQQVEHLRDGTFIGEAINLVAVGTPGVGKSHLLAALGHELVLQGRAVCWTSTASLVQRLLAAKRDLRLTQELKRLDRYACLILDDIGYVQHDRDEMEVLFTLLAERYERRPPQADGDLDQPGLLRVGAHLQGPDDHLGGHRPRRASLGDLGPHEYGQLPRAGSHQPAGSVPTVASSAHGPPGREGAGLTVPSTPFPVRDDPRDGTTPPDPVPPCLLCAAPRRSGRGRYCSAACRQRAFRLRHTALPNLEEGLLRKALRRRAMLTEHTVYECPECETRYLGEQRCAECNRFCRVAGLGGACPDCEQPVLLSDLLDFGGVAFPPHREA